MRSFGPPFTPSGKLAGPLSTTGGLPPSAAGRPPLGSSQHLTAQLTASASSASLNAAGRGGSGSGPPSSRGEGGGGGGLGRRSDRGRHQVEFAAGPGPGSRCSDRGAGFAGRHASERSLGAALRASDRGTLSLGPSFSIGRAASERGGGALALAAVLGVERERERERGLGAGSTGSGTSVSALGSDSNLVSLQRLSSLAARSRLAAPFKSLKGGSSSSRHDGASTPGSTRGGGGGGGAGKSQLLGPRASYRSLTASAARSEPDLARVSGASSLTSGTSLSMQTPLGSYSMQVRFRV